MEYLAEPSLTDKLKALAELNKMDGDYAPTKQEVNISTPVLPPFMKTNESQS